MDRKARGICFRCWERFHPLHQCAGKQLRLVILGDDEVTDEAGEVLAIELKEWEEDVAVRCNSAVLFRIEDEGKSQNWFPFPLRLEGTVKGIPVTMMVDTGATHNFVTPQMVAVLQLPVEQIPVTNAKFGNGSRVAITEKCGKFDIQIGRFQTTVEAYIMELQGEDMILGVAWLHKLGKVLFDWEEIAICLDWKGKTVKLQFQNPENWRINQEK
ncbi:uncharacterized protein [Cicer arietinum]|uniref:uncharacterized protein n=1 Tax=Cicer arietinum TaxID=3827 RepID=UPI003CC50760